MKNLVFLASFLLVSIFAFSQAPSKIPQGLGAKGTEVKVADQLSIDSALKLPKDTIKLLIKDTGALAYKNGVIYILKNMGGSVAWEATTKVVTANRALMSDANGIPTPSGVTNTELDYLSGVTSSIQTQLNTKLSNITGLVTQGTNITITGNGTSGDPYVVNSNGDSTTFSTNYRRDTAIANVRDEIAGKQPTGNYITGLTGDVAAVGPGLVAATISNGAITAVKISDGAVTMQKLNTTGTPDGTKFLRDDGAWATPAAGGTQNLQQVFDQGSVLTKSDTIYQQNNLLLTTGQLVNGDTIHYDENKKLLVYGVSIDRGDTSGANNLYSTDWVKQLAASMGLYTDNRSVSGSKLIKVSNGDNSLEDLLPSIPVYNSTVKLLAIGNYQVNEVDFNDSTLYRSTLEMILDTLIIARGYPASKIFLLNGTPARLKDTARLRRLSVATMNVAIEKGCLYWDSYSYMLPCLSCNRMGGDDVHLTPHGYFYLTDGILNASVIDSLNYIRANNMHVENAFTSHGVLYANDILNYGKDSTFGNQYIGGTLNLVGNVLNATTFNNGITITGDAVPNAQKWVLFRNGNVRYGMGLSGTDYRIFTSDAAALRLGSISASDGTTFTPTFSTTTGSNTSHVQFIASTSASVGTSLTVTGGASIGGDATFREINVYNNGGLKFGSRMSGSSPFFNDIYCGHNITTNAVRLGWVDASNVFTPVLTAIRNGNVLIGTSTDNSIGKLQVNGKVTIATADSTASPANMLWMDPTTKEIKKAAVPSGSDGNGIYGGNGSLSSDVTVSTAGNTLSITGTNDSETSLTVTNNGTTAANAIAGTVTGSTGAGVTGTSTAGNGVVGSSSSNYGIVGVTTSGQAIRGQANPASTNAVETVMSLLRTTSAGAGANGLGAAIQFELETATNGTSQAAGTVSFEWTDATNSTQTSKYKVRTTNSGTLGDRFTVNGNGQIQHNAYGTGTFSVTPATTPIYSSTGVIGERVAPKIYTALLNQSGASAPTVTVLGTNEIGTIVWTRNSTGNYTGTLSGAFTANKTWLIIQQGDQTGSFINSILSWTDANSLLLTTTDNVGNPADGFTNMSLEIRVYP